MTRLRDAPALDTSTPENQRLEADLVVENVLGSMLGSMRRHITKKTKKAPTAKGYAKILLQDLRARGFDIVQTEKP